MGGGGGIGPFDVWPYPNYIDYLHLSLFDGRDGQTLSEMGAQKRLYVEIAVME